jgi:hypothetical protein
MDFRDLAETRTSELISRLVDASREQPRQQILRLRSALDDAMSALERALDVSEPEEREVQALVDQLAAAASAHAEQAVANAIEPLQSDLASQTDEIATLAGSLEEAQSQADALREVIDSARSEAESARSEADSARVETDSVRGEAEALRSRLEGLEADMEAARTLTDEALADRARFEEAASIAHSQAEAADAKLEAVTALFKTANTRVKALERAQEEHDRVVRGLQAKLHAKTTSASADHRGSIALLDELLGSFEALSGATTIADVLTTLTEQLAADFCRVALFRVKGNRLEGEHQIGIDLPADVAKVVMPLSMDSFLTRAAASGVLMRLSGDELADSSRAPFSGSPTCALALPIAVSGEPFAVVYADDSGQAESGRAAIDLERSARIADALRQHVVALLTRLTNELKALAELRGYADLLLKEMEQMYNADVEAGQSGEPLVSSLRSNLDYARSIFASRVTTEGPDAAKLLDDQIGGLIDARRESPFGRDLAAATGRADLDASDARVSAGA